MIYLAVLLLIKMDQSIHIKKLRGYKKTDWSEDYFVETIDKKYGLWFYNVEEHSMLSYFGHIAIFENNKKNLQILSSGNVWAWYRTNNTFMYPPKSDCLIFRMPAYQGEVSIKPDFPYLLIKPNSKSFSFIDWDFTSIYYSFDEINTNVIEVKEVSPKELDRVNFPRRTGEIIDFNNLIWHNLRDFDTAIEIYLNK
jgi:hypothetical protein